MAKKKNSGIRVIAENRKARHNYAIEDDIEAGIVLQGSEVKSLRDGQANIAESYASVDDGELYLVNANIPEYAKASHFNHDARRPRKLLLHAKELAKLIIAVDREGMTLVPLSLYFNERNIVKLKLALAKGKKIHDKRQSEKKRDWDRQKARLMREKG